MYANPFFDHEDLVARTLEATVKLFSGDTSALRVMSLRAKSTIDSGLELPSTWLQYRLGLTESEARVVWLLIAHELCPETRKLIRDMATESSLDPTFDVIRRVVYGTGASLKTWKELGPEGKLRRLEIIERTDGNGEVAEQRQTFKIARRVLALAHGDTGIDPELDGSGGYIRNAVLRAAFLAADDELPIATTHLERAARL